MKTMHLFAGIGGGLLADLILGHEPIIAVEWDKYACRVLRERAADGWFPGLHVWEGDVRLFDPSEYAGSVDCIHAGFPCQDISVAGKQAGVSEGTRSGLYREVLRIAGIVRPRYLFLENVAAILSNGLGTVLADLAAMGYDTRWCCIRASDVGAPHHRDRWFLLADASSGRLGESGEGKVQLTRGSEAIGSGEDMGNAEHAGLNAAEVTGSIAQGSDGSETWQEQTGEPAGSGDAEVLADSDATGLQERLVQPGIQGRAQQTHQRENTPMGSWWTTVAGLGELADGLSDRVGWFEVEPDIGRVAIGVKNRVGQLKGYGNAQVPLQSAAAWRLLGGD
jgi:DNA (cytosine-5)-methyltransferase 1